MTAPTESIESDTDKLPGGTTPSKQATLVDDAEVTGQTAPPTDTDNAEIEEPKLCPLMTSVVPGPPDVGEMELMDGVDRAAGV